LKDIIGLGVDGSVLRTLIIQVWSLTHRHGA